MGMREGNGVMGDGDFECGGFGNIYFYEGVIKGTKVIALIKRM